MTTVSFAGVKEYGRATVLLSLVPFSIVRTHFISRIAATVPDRYSTPQVQAAPVSTQQTTVVVQKEMEEEEGEGAAPEFTDLPLHFLINVL